MGFVPEKNRWQRHFRCELVCALILTRSLSRSCFLEIFITCTHAHTPKPTVIGVCMHVSVSVCAPHIQRLHKRVWMWQMIAQTNTHYITELSKRVYSSRTTTSMWTKRNNNVVDRVRKVGIASNSLYFFWCVQFNFFFLSLNRWISWKFLIFIIVQKHIPFVSLLFGASIDAHTVSVIWAILYTQHSAVLCTFVRNRDDNRREKEKTK